MRTPAASSGCVAALPDERHLRQRLLAAAGVVALGAGAVAALPGLDEVRQRFAAAAPGWLALVLVLEIGSCLAFVAVFRGVFCARLRWGPSYHLGMTVQGTNVLLPAGEPAAWRSAPGYSTGWAPPLRNSGCAASASSSSPAR